MEKFNIHWLWFVLAIAALAAGVMAKAMAALFYLLAVALAIVGIVMLVRRM